VRADVPEGQYHDALGGEFAFDPAQMADAGSSANTATIRSRSEPFSAVK
jgi:hypothetical protein